MYDVAVGGCMNGRICTRFENCVAIRTAGTVHARGFTSDLYNIQGWLYIGINDRKSQLHERTTKAGC